ncbi:hypothetical protein ACYSNM_13055 [Myroides sp. LJL116]
MIEAESFSLIAFFVLVKILFYKVVGGAFFLFCNFNDYLERYFIRMKFQAGYILDGVLGFITLFGE